MGSIITKIILAVLKFFSRKEGEAENRGHEYDSADNFSVHAPKWIIPIIVIFELFFGGFAVFSYLWDLKIAIPCFIVICLLGLLAFAHDQCFKISIDGQQITVARLFKGTKFFQCSQIISARSDNAGNVFVLFEAEKVTIEFTMVNKDRFLEFAQKWAWHNIDSHVNQKYKITNGKGNLIFSFLCSALFGGMLCYLPFGLEEEDLLVKIGVLIFCGVLFLISIFWFLDSTGSTIFVDEEKLCFSYRKGFVKKSVDMQQIEFLRTKQRFGESSAFNYILTVALPNGKVDKVKFSSLSDNSDRFANLLLKKFLTEDS